MLNGRACRPGIIKQDAIEAIKKNVINRQGSL